MTEPAFSFAAIAVGLREAATQVAISVEGCEHLAESLPPTPGITHALNTLRRRAEYIAAAHFFFKALSEHEADVLAILANIDRKVA